MMAARRGLTGEVPHWYCYIPFFPSSDCWKSFGQGTAELASSTVGAALSGAAQQLTGSGDKLAGEADTNWWLWIGLGMAGVVVLATSRGGRRYR